MAKRKSRETPHKRNWLIEQRKAAGFENSADFAEHIGISRTYYYEIEMGLNSPGGKTAFKIAETLNFKMEKFYHELVA